jgi:hypothetical protein
LGQLKKNLNVSSIHFNYSQLKMAALLGDDALSDMKPFFPSSDEDEDEDTEEISKKHNKSKSTKPKKSRGVGVRVFFPTQGIWRDCSGNIYRTIRAGYEPLPKDNTILIPATMYENSLIINQDDLPVEYSETKWRHVKRSIWVKRGRAAKVQRKENILCLSDPVYKNQPKISS